MIARMQVRATAWSALQSAYDDCVATPESCTLDSDVRRLMKNGQIVEIEAQNPADFTMLDVTGSMAQINALYGYFAPADKLSNQPWLWDFEGRVWVPTEYEGQQNDILASQPPVATLENPNWVHGWAGQGTNRLAREYSLEFGDEFQ